MFALNKFLSICQILGITKVPPNDQQLFYNGIVLDDNKSFEQCGLNYKMAPPLGPATIALALRYLFSISVLLLSATIPDHCYQF